ncbi:hypothetical protein LTR10_006365 [Elasticomyces elasticus]|nr:hypothetical protein LTR10_006365 [Elasticomyces elasticus]KAK4966587.1 hypothetical protein LTR42_010898 [Elasticomyces elasticus]
MSAELRNNIYELVLLSEDTIDIRTESQPALAKTCRQIREECIQIYYSRSKFEFVTASARDDALDGIANWLGRIGSDHCRALRTIKVKTGVPNGLMLDNQDSSHQKTPWAKMVRRMKELGVTAGLAIDVELQQEPFKPVWVEMMRRHITVKKAVHDLDERRTNFMRGYVESLAIKVLGRKQTEPCLHLSTGPVTSEDPMSLLQCTGTFDDMLYPGRPENRGWVLQVPT